MRVLSSAASRIHFADGTAGQDVVELKQEQVLRRRIQRAKIDGDAAHRCHEPGDLGLTQGQLVLPIGPLDLAVCRVGATMRLQIGLAHPGREIRSQGTGIMDQRAGVRSQSASVVRRPSSVVHVSRRRTSSKYASPPPWRHAGRPGNDLRARCTRASSSVGSPTNGYPRISYYDETNKSAQIRHV